MQPTSCSKDATAHSCLLALPKTLSSANVSVHADSQFPASETLPALLVPSLGSWDSWTSIGLGIGKLFFQTLLSHNILWQTLKATPFLCFHSLTYSSGLLFWRWCAFPCPPGGKVRWGPGINKYVTTNAVASVTTERGKEMGDTGKEDYKIHSFDTEIQHLLKTALKDPNSVDLEKVANVIVDQSLKDCVFSKEAGRICYTIIQAESKQVGQSVFRRGLLNRLQQEYKDRDELRARSLQAWIGYVTFICSIFDYLRVDCLVLQLHRIGEQLEKMNSQRMDELFSLLRDGFLLQEGLSSLSQLLLLEIIEFRAADWKMTDAAQKYYYSEVTD
nr:PREDICTED: MIF4G domain-containing protein isoform X2 [Anolis carolinensis]|eukprot:XP_016846837.1 PREDICTED: MIF4G domain-containing protein isoform X2 [Anolis carolinensis]